MKKNSSSYNFKSFLFEMIFIIRTFRTFPFNFGNWKSNTYDERIVLVGCFFFWRRVFHVGKEMSIDLMLCPDLRYWSRHKIRIYYNICSMLVRSNGNFKIGKRRSKMKGGSIFSARKILFLIRFRKIPSFRMCNSIDLISMIKFCYSSNWFSSKVFS